LDQSGIILAGETPLVYDLTPDWLLEEPLQEEEEMAEEREALPPPIRAEAVFHSHQPYFFSNESFVPKPISKPATTLQSSRPTVRAEAEAGPSRPRPIGTSRTSPLAEAELEQSRPSRLVAAETEAGAGPHRSVQLSRLAEAEVSVSRTAGPSSSSWAAEAGPS
jgi:hypothetical protein